MHVIQLKIIEIGDLKVFLVESSQHYRLKVLFVKRRSSTVYKKLQQNRNKI